jgi:amidase
VSDSEICFLEATELARLIRVRELSAREVMEAHLAQIERVNKEVNAIVTFLPEQAMERARAADDMLARGEEVGPLVGLPLAHKDLVPTKGVRTTYGSLVYKDFVPDHDALIVDRLRDAGAISVGKTNTPEFGAGSQTYNEVFGETLNPYDTTKTCGGSSGGAAVALACGMLPLADGSDLGGSLRNPAAFCNVVGFRPSPGRVPKWPSLAAWFPFSVEGPMARTVQDVALMLSAIAGPDPRSPVALPEPGASFAHPPERDFGGVRIAEQDAILGMPIARLGITLSEAFVRRLVALTGPGKMKDLVYTGRFIDAEEALRLGLVERVVPQDKSVLHETLLVARTIRQHSKASIRAAKRWGGSGSGRAPAAYGYVDPKEFPEGMRAYLDGRTPRFYNP